MNRSFLMALLALLLSTLPLRADEMPQSYTKVFGKGFICDTAGEVASVIDYASMSGNMDDAVMRVPGCGWISRPFPGFAQYIRHYSANGTVARIIQINMPGGTQYAVDMIDISKSIVFQQANAEITL